MKKNNFDTLREKSVKHLSSKYSKDKLKLSKLKAEYAVGKVKKTKKLKILKKEIAQLLTIKREKEIIEATQSKKDEGRKK